ncbi:hypothetical protein KUA24_34 [Vibrio phage HNL01]|nr:hypothetical protein KUA24_34 [Vibrio phage HNL01]
MKVKLLPTNSSDAGDYLGTRNVDWDNAIVEARYATEKENSILVSSDEFIRVGGCPDAFNKGKGYDYLYGNFEVLED